MTFRKKNGAEIKVPPFIVTFAPFIGDNGTRIFPFIGKKPPSVGNPRNEGFTLLELVITLTVVAILLVLAAPQISTFLHSNRLTATTNDLIVDFNIARSEAIKRSTNAIICKSDDGSSCTGTGTWMSGWVVFADVDNSGSWTQTAGQEDVLLRTHEVLGSGMAITGSSDIVIYNRQGLVPAVPAGGEWSYVVCSVVIGKTRTLNVSTTGRARLTTSGNC